MDSGRFLLAVILMIAVMVITNMLFAPRPPAPGTVPDSAVIVDTLSGTDTTARRSDTIGARPEPLPTVEPAAQQPVAVGDTLFVSTPLQRIGFGPDGGIVSAVLQEYEAFGDDVAEDQRVELAPPGDALLTPRLRVGDGIVALPLQPDSTQDVTLTAGDQPHNVAFSYDDGTRALRLVYTVDPDSYMIDVRYDATGFAQTPQLLLELPSTLRMNDADPNEDRRALAYVVNSERQGIQSVRLAKVDEERVENGPFTWVAVKNKYFLVAALVSEEGALPFGGVRARPLGGETVDLVATLPSSAGSFAFDVYIGPQEADRLAAVGHELEDVNPYGWRLFRPMLRPLGHGITWALTGIHNTLGIGYGWVLILFGVLVRVVLWPFNAKAMRSQLKNMELQPRIKEIQEKYKNNPEQMQKEMMKLYKEGFNPVGGCLPMLVPFPVLIALFFVFQSTIEFRGVEFLWLPDLSRFDPLYILPVLLGITMFLQQWITTKSTPANAQNPQMKMMMYFMPLFMTVIFLRFASGLNLYYVAQNIASIPQSLQLMQERKKWHESKR